jgi:hypothetical protein
MRAAPAPRPRERSRIGKTFVNGIAGPGIASGGICALPAAVAVSLGGEDER